MKSLILACLFIFVCCSSGPKELTPQGSAVKYMKADPPSGCTEVGVFNSAEAGRCAGLIENCSPSEFRNFFRNFLATKGVNYFRLEKVDSKTGHEEGTGFHCP